MEVVGVASAIAGLLSLTLNVYLEVSLFVVSTKQAEVLSYEKQIQNELKSISDLLVKLQNVILRPEVSSSALGLDSKINDGIRLLETLKRTYLCRPATPFLRKLTTTTKVTFRKLHLVSTRRSLERHLSDLKDCRGSLENGATPLLRACSQPSNPLVGISQRRLEILQWLSPLDHREKFHELRRKRVRLSDSNRAHNSLEEFNNFASKYSRQLENFDLWRNRELSRPETPNTLWCHGAAGSGKSMLTSLFIDRLSEEGAEKNYAVVYYFFDYKFKRFLSEMVAILLKQLCLVIPNIPDAVAELFVQATEDEERPPLEALLNTITSVSGKFSRTFIVIDAIDEHGSPKETELLLTVLGTLQCDLLITSRHGVSGILDEFPPSLLQLTVEPNFQAICHFVKKKIEESEDLWFADTAVKEKIGQELLKEGSESRAKQGQCMDHKPNFLLAALQVDRLLEQFSPKQDIKTLQPIPLDLKQMLNNTWRRIEELQPSSNGLIAKRALMWVLHAKRPLSMAELCTALSVPDNTPNFNQHTIPTPKLILQSCGGLIAVGDSGSTVSLVHYQVHEYFQGIRENLFPQGHEDLALTCAIYLTNLLEKYPDDLDNDDYFASAVSLNPFLDYAAYYWRSHCQDRRRTECSSGVAKKSDLAMDDFERAESNTTRDLGNRITMANLKLLSLGKTATLPCNVVIPDSKRILSELFSKHPLWEYQLHLAARFGLLDETRYLIDRQSSEMPKSAIGALRWSAAEGNTEIAHILIARGGNRACRDEGGRIPLHHAASHGRLEMVNFLDSSFSRRPQDNPFNLGDESEDHLLNCQDIKKKTPLHLAAENGHSAVVRILCSRTANISLADDQGRSAIHLAVMTGRPSTVAALISKGATVDIRDYKGLTSLHHAAKRRSEGILNRLLMSGAKLSAKDDQGKTPLHHAAMNRHSTAIINTMLSSGAHINDQDHEGETALIKAISTKDIGIVKTLLRYGASFAKQTKDGLTALHRAAQEGEEDIVLLLLEYGSNPNLKDSGGSSPCDYASRMGHGAVADLLWSAAGISNRRVQTRPPMAHVMA